ncbi:tetratricopeptide repeat protein [Nibricoccus sp. IMCC34717]|uniref:tetratricopeptide repeat protein n=1 Tax=Nibricoccus sp. IMCC34717 TaxID=3034021 RepID=UPI00384EA6FB
MNGTPRKSDTFREMVARQPDNELFRFSLAQALVAECRYLDAVEHFRFCVKKKPDWMVARIQLGKLYLELGKQPEAILQLQEALKLAVDQHHEDPERELRALLNDLRANG